MDAYELYLKQSLNWFDRLVVRCFCGRQTAWGAI